MKSLAINLDTIMTDHQGDSCIDSDTFLKIARSWGATLVGIGDVSIGLAGEFRHIPLAISLAIAHPPVEEGLFSKDSVTAYSNQFPEVDARLELIQARVSSYLRSQGWNAFVIPPDTGKQDSRFAARLYPLFPHKTSATCAGLGWVGRNGLLVTKEYGARLSWGTVLTNAPLKVCEKPYVKSHCGNCKLCKQACPSGAIRGNDWSRDNGNKPLIDVEKCARQLSLNHQVIGKYICGYCMVVCPVGVEKTPIKGGR